MSIQDPSSEANANLVDEASRGTGGGARNSSMYNAFRGINHRNAGTSPLTANQDSVGLTFFTRPILNLAYNNIARHRRLEFLGDTNSRSMGCLIKSMLSPFAVSGIPWDNTKGNVRSEIFDDSFPFMAILTNSLMNLSGWPDTTVDTYTSDEGIAKETVSWVDGRAEYRGTYSLTANFRNMDGDPITTLFDAWVYYSSCVADGTLVPYPEMIVEKEIDYMCRIYRLVLNKEGTHVTKIAATGASFPTAVPNGAAFNFESSDNISTENAQISIPFQCIGALYNDPILIKEFNEEVVERYQPLMRDDSRADNMIQLTAGVLEYFNNKGYPRIEEDNRLTWWVTTEQYNQYLSYLSGGKEE